MTRSAHEVHSRRKNVVKWPVHTGGTAAHDATEPDQGPGTFAVMLHVMGAERLGPMRSASRSIVT